MEVVVVAGTQKWARNDHRHARCYFTRLYEHVHSNASTLSRSCPSGPQCTIYRTILKGLRLVLMICIARIAMNTDHPLSVDLRLFVRNYNVTCQTKLAWKRRLEDFPD